MPRIDEYQEVTSPQDSDLFLLERGSGNSAEYKKIQKVTLLKAIWDKIGSTAFSSIGSSTITGALNILYNKHRRTRNNITNNISNLLTAINAQNLEKYGYTIGDYFVGPVSGYKYYLADLDTYYGGYDSCSIVSTHHIAVLVQTNTNTVWGSAASSGYNGSTLKTLLEGTVLTNIKADMKSLFGGSTGLEHLVSHQKLFTTAVSNWGWQTSKYISALTEGDVFGGRIWALDGYQFGEAVKQLAIFRKFRFNEIFGNISIWLRSLASSSTACCVSRTGHALSTAISDSGEAVGLIMIKK